MKVTALIDKLSFAEEALAQALLEQAMLLMEASRYRVRKMRARLAADADFNRMCAEVSLMLRRSEKKRTEGYIRDVVTASPRIRKAKQLLDEAKVSEEAAKMLLDAYHARGSMAKALVELIGAQAAVESKFIRGELERMGLSKITQKVRNRFRGEQDGE